MKLYIHNILSILVTISSVNYSYATQSLDDSDVSSTSKRPNLQPTETFEHIIQPYYAFNKFINPSTSELNLQIEYNHDLFRKGLGFKRGSKAVPDFSTGVKYHF